MTFSCVNFVNVNINYTFTEYNGMSFTMSKMALLQLALQLGFLITEVIYN
jgi:hypothetical protein